VGFGFWCIAIPVGFGLHPWGLGLLFCKHRNRKKRHRQYTEQQSNADLLRDPGIHDFRSMANPLNQLQNEFDVYDSAPS
jgi:hypothetical protein